MQSRIRTNSFQEFIIRVKRAGNSDIYVGRRYGEFSKLHKRLKTELPGKVLAPLPRKNKAHTSALLSLGGDDDDASSVSSVSTQNTQYTAPDDSSSFRNLIGMGHGRNPSIQSTPRMSGEIPREKIVLYRENQRVSLRAFLRTFLQNEQIAESKAMHDFLTRDPVQLNQEELEDLQRRKNMDEKRIEEQKRFYEIARERARELDIYMERFRRDIVERSMSSAEYRSGVRTDGHCRWAYEAFPGDQREREDLRLDCGVSKIRRVASNRVSVAIRTLSIYLTDRRTGLLQQFIIFSLPKTIPLNY